MNGITTLDEIGLHYGTDKASHGHDYLRVYDEYLWPRQVNIHAFLEVGWWKGESMRMWRDYLPPDCAVVGVDIEQKDPLPGVHFRQADQRDKARLDVISNEFGLWDVIVDDASHISAYTRATFQHLWPHLRPGGLYFVEDLQVSYHPSWGGHPDPDSRGTIMHALKRLADGVHHGHAGVDQRPAPAYAVDHVAFYPGLCVVRKAVS